MRTREQINAKRRERYAKDPSKALEQVRKWKDMRWEAGLFTFIFSEETDIKKLNDAVGFPVFQIEGSIGDRLDWSAFPWQA